MKSPLILAIAALALTACSTTNDTSSNTKTAGAIGTTETPSRSQGHEQDTSQRPPLLVPGAIPDGVRYAYAPDAEVIASHALLDEALSAKTSLFSEFLLVNPGAWSWFKSIPGIGKTESIPMTSVAPMGARTLKLEGIVLRNGNELKKLNAALVSLLERDGGYAIRAMTTSEMKEWWPFISFDISEPTFIVESARGKYRFVAHLDDGRIVNLDELNALKKHF